MNWSEEEVLAAQRAAEAVTGEEIPADVVDDARKVFRVIMTFAVDLAAARGGTMTARDRKELREALLNGTEIPHARTCLAAALDDMDAQGATVATLQAKVAELEAHASRLEEVARLAGAEVEGLKAELERCPVAGEGWLSRVRAAESQLAEARATIARLTAAGQVLSDHADKAGGPAPGPACTCHMLQRDTQWHDTDCPARPQETP